MYKVARAGRSYRDVKEVETIRSCGRWYKVSELLGGVECGDTVDTQEGQFLTLEAMSACYFCNYKYSNIDLLRIVAFFIIFGMKQNDILHADSDLFLHAET